MLLDQIGLLFKISLILDHDLMLVLMILYQHNSFFIKQITYKLVALINYHSFWLESKITMQIM